MAASDRDPPRLVVISPAEHPPLVLTQPEMVIGRSDTAHLILHDRSVSRRHALINVDSAGRVTIHDLNSHGGTFVNDERISGPRLLTAGDRVRFADQVVARFEPASTAGTETVILHVPTQGLPIASQDQPAPTTAATGTRATPEKPRQAPAPVAGQADVAPDAKTVRRDRSATTSPAPGSPEAGAGKAPIMPPPPRPGPSPGPPVASLAKVLPGAGAGQLISTLADHGIRTLADVRHAGSLSTITTPADEETLRLIEAHADLARLSSDFTANAAIIAAGFSSSVAIARAPQSVFVTAAAPAVGEAAAITLHSQAVAMYSALDQLVAGAQLDLASAAGTSGYPDAVNNAVNPQAYQRCDCDDCQSAVSPTAYLADLLNYVTTHLLAYGEQVGLPYLEKNFYQPFGDLPTDCAAVQTLVRQVRICCEVLRGYQKALPPTGPETASLQAREAAYLMAVNQALLTGLGTSFDELRLAGIADPATRSALADRLGLMIDPYGGGRPDVLDQLLLAPATTTPPPPAAQVLTEASIERTFGLPATDVTRNPLSDGPVIGDPGGIIGQWNPDGVTWGRNTSPDGTIYLWLAQPGAGQLDVALYKDKGFTELVAFGQLTPAGAGLPGEHHGSAGEQQRSVGCHRGHSGRADAGDLAGRHPAADVLATGRAAGEMAGPGPPRRSVCRRVERRPADRAARRASPARRGAVGQL